MSRRMLGALASAVVIVATLTSCMTTPDRALPRGPILDPSELHSPVAVPATPVATPRETRRPDPPDPPEPTGNGSLQIASSTPFSLAGSVATDVDCVAASGRHVTTIPAAQLDDVTLRLVVTFESYAGPGVYDALVEVRLTPVDGDVVEFSGTTTAVFDENGHGAMGVNLRGAAGEFSASIQWDCGATRTPR